MFNSDSKSSLRQYLIKGVSGSFIIRVASTALSFGVAVVLARILGAEGFGVYAFCISASQLLAVPAMLGLPQLIVREVSAYQNKENFALMRGILRRSWQGIVIVSLLFIIVIGISVSYLTRYIDAMSLPSFWFALLLVPLLALIRVQGSALRGLKKIIWGQMGDLLRPGLFLLAIMFLCFFLHFEITPWHAVALQVITLMIILVIIGNILYWNLPFKLKKTKPEYNTSVWLSSTWPMLITQSMHAINNQSSIIMLGFLGSAEGVGIFRIAQRAAMLVPFGMQALTVTIAPTISSYYIQGELKRLQQLLTRTTRMVLAFSLPIAVILMIGSFWIVPFIFGADFQQAVWPLIILCLGQLVNIAIGPVENVLTMTQNERISAKGVSFGTILNIILHLILIPMWGVMGAAIATSLTIVIWNVLLAVLLFRKLRISSSALGKIEKNGT